MCILDTRVRINNQYWRRSEIIMILCKIRYSHLRYTDRLLDVLFLLLAVVLSELHENTREKNWITEKRMQKNLFERHIFLAARPSSYVTLLSTLSLLSHATLSRKKICSRKLCVCVCVCLCLCVRLRVCVFVGGGGVTRSPLTPTFTCVYGFMYIHTLSCQHRVQKL